jgi:orotate phosphoribosyltransferase-like protein
MSNIGESNMMSIDKNTDSVNFESDVIAPNLNDDSAISATEQTSTNTNEGSVASAPAQSANNSMSVASLILGIASLGFFWAIPYATIVSSIIGLVLGVISRKRQKDGVGLAGIIISIIALLLSLILLAIIIFPIIILSIGLSD